MGRVDSPDMPQFWRWLETNADYNKSTPCTGTSASSPVERLAHCQAIPILSYKTLLPPFPSSYGNKTHIRTIEYWSWLHVECTDLIWKMDWVKRDATEVFPTPDSPTRAILNWKVLNSSSSFSLSKSSSMVNQVVFCDGRWDTYGRIWWRNSWNTNWRYLRINAGISWVYGPGKWPKGLRCFRLENGLGYCGNGMDETRV